MRQKRRRNLHEARASPHACSDKTGSVDEIIRILTALRKTASGKVFTPEGWRPGKDVLAPPEQTLPTAFLPSAGHDWFYKLMKDNK